MASSLWRIPLRGSLSFRNRNRCNCFEQLELNYSTCYSQHKLHRAILSKNPDTVVISHPIESSMHEIARNLRPSVNILCRYQSNGTFDRDNDNNPRKVTPVFVAVPNPLKVIRNWMFGVIIRAYFDPEFTFKEFTEGAKQGLSIISHEMATGELDNISDMVSPKLLPELREVVRKMSRGERSRLAVSVQDILYTFPQNMTVHYDDKGGRFLYILMKFWCLSSDTPKDESQGYGFKIGTRPPGVSQEEFDNVGSIVSCTYEFLRELTPGVAPDWTVSHIEHGKQINTEARGLPPP